MAKEKKLLCQSKKPQQDSKNGQQFFKGNPKYLSL
jgi:hypothetical protein